MLHLTYPTLAVVCGSGELPTWPSPFSTPLHFQSEAAAFAAVEQRSCGRMNCSARHCGERERVGRLIIGQDDPARPGCWALHLQGPLHRAPRDHLQQSSHLALHLWLQVIHPEVCASKKRHQLCVSGVQRMLGSSWMKTAWFLTHRIRAAMGDGSLEPFGSDGGAVEVDETFIGTKKDAKVRRGAKRTRTPSLASLSAAPVACKASWSTASRLTRCATFSGPASRARPN